MARRMVRAARRVTQPADMVWAQVSDFAGLWHPAIETSELHFDRGCLIRTFHGRDGGDYVERLTYLSHHDQCLSYEMVSGIEGAQNYAATVRVTPAGAAAEIVWSAEIDADADRAEAIAAGTEAVFAEGLDALAAPASPTPKTAPPALPPAATHPAIRRSVTGGLSLLAGAVGTGRTWVLFLHGIGGQADNWRGQLARFGGDYPMAALDLRGYGHSARGTARTSLQDHCADIETAMERLGAERIIVVGLSFGAWIAASFATAHPDKVAGLVVAGGCTGMSEAPEAVRVGFRKARLGPLDAGQSPEDLAPAIVETLAGPETSDATRAALLRSMAAIPAETYRDAVTCFCAPPGPLAFERLDCPVLLMTGRHDVLAPPEEIRAVSLRMHAAMARPDIRFEILADAGHVCNLDAPDAFDAHLAAFLDRLGPA